MEYINILELQDESVSEKIVFISGLEKMDVAYLNRLKGSDELFLSQMISIRYGNS